MRKILLTLVTLVGICLHVSAQGMTATLQSGENLSVFYGVDAFKEAYTAAVDGDQITLSAGTFNAPESNITKSVKITGTGAYEESANTTFETLTASGTDIRIEGVKFSKTLYVSGSTNLIVTRCWVEALNASSTYNGAVFDETVFKNINGMPYAVGFTFKNCTINSFLDTNSTTNIGQILNCVIYYYGDSNDGSLRYYTFYSSARQPYAIYKNCILGTYQYATEGLPGKKPSEFYYNVGYQENSNTSFKFDSDCVNVGNRIMTYTELFGGAKLFPAKPVNVPNGEDDTPVGPYGGTGFSQYPAIPRIISQSVDGSTNDEGKINVKIEVKAEN